MIHEETSTDVFQGLPYSALFVYAALRDASEPLTQSDLVSSTHGSRRTIQRSLAKLHSRGVVIKTPSQQSGSNFEYWADVSTVIDP